VESSFPKNSLINRSDLERQERETLAPYAVHSGFSLGRFYEEDEHPYRTCFQRDRDRVIHTSAFRRLEYKTQVFVYHEGDYYRTRLTHSLEVAQVARSIAKSLRLNEDLTETVALAHDLGHPPFGHTGQAVLNRLMQGHGGFEHNRQSLRIVKYLEKRYPEFSGLNLTWEALEGISKHKKDPDNPISASRKYRHPSMEAQVADYADSIAYNAHDLDDGVTSGLLSFDKLGGVTLWRENEARLRASYANLDNTLKKYLIVRNIINALVTDLRENTLTNIGKFSVKSADDVRVCPKKIVGFGEEVEAKHRELKRFLLKNMYQHRRVLRMEFKSERYLTRLFEAYLQNPGFLTEPVGKSDETKYRVICDTISSMTDRHAISEYRKLFDPDPEERDWAGEL
tara:strand:- start:688 stop:1878 length:1191 start_codon:yes stop_codon:yes gene_type:complete